MEGIDLNSPVEYLYSSLRFFSEKEYHVTRFCEENVLLMVYDGILRFTEDGTAYEIHPGEYHIQKSGSFQSADSPSDAPKYLYVHFNASQTENDDALPFEGCFDYSKAKPLMEKLDTLSHSKTTLIEKVSVFYRILTLLRNEEKSVSLAGKIAEFISDEPPCNLSLELLCNKFHFSKNHIINIFKKEFGTTPVKYIINLKLARAKYLLEVTSDSAESIALSCGFNDYSHFYKLFCRENGISPVAWRKQRQTNPL